ncbi:hypothetical protein [Candidatus Magnetaquicoccus inordinatus]|uniref:hypothetical protein n=1 Tax=Candidatus Magnetaquicoccus inordinatus TaxID=2496818 RepID=UPI00102B3683|nr:hypothetical protein [Candidatus Magnetaquicoccus inordinatus]
MFIIGNTGNISQQKEIFVGKHNIVGVVIPPVGNNNHKSQLDGYTSNDIKYNYAQNQENKFAKISEKSFLSGCESIVANRYSDKDRGGNRK